MSSRDRQLVYCHECENEWYKDEQGLKCPQCESEFVEELGGGEDPRQELHIPPDIYDDDPDVSVPDEHPLQHHNPWAHHQDPVAHDNGMHMPGQFGFSGPGGGGVRIGMTHSFPPGANAREGPGRQPGGRAHDPMIDLQSNFFNMVNGMMGARTGGFATPGGGRGFRSVRVTTASFGGPGGATFRTETLHPRGDADGPQPGQQQPMDDLHRMLFGSMMGHETAGGDPHAHAFPFPGAIGGLFQMLNPANAQHGDAVFSQEALDRVISQLMEQNQMGNAPPPAAQQDIETLPKIKVTADMGDSKTGNADCAICMDTVPVGEEVTRLWCGHWFHGDCIGAWLHEHDSCPQCRKGIVQARDEAMGRSTSAPPSQGPTSPPGAPPPASEGRRMSSRRTSSAQNLFGTDGADGAQRATPSMPQMPMSGSYGGYANSAARRPSQGGRSESQQQQTQQAQQPQPQPQQPSGFADRVRGLFRGNGS